jgi:hypothetical protein
MPFIYAGGRFLVHLSGRIKGKQSVDRTPTVRFLALF